jgi:hypothetical protein
MTIRDTSFCRNSYISHLPFADQNFRTNTFRPLLPKSIHKRPVYMRSAVHLLSSLLQFACILMLLLGMGNPRLEPSLYKFYALSFYSGRNVKFPSFYGVQYSIRRGKFLLPACAILAFLPIILSDCSLSLSLTQRST